MNRVKLFIAFLFCSVVMLSCKKDGSTTKENNTSNRPLYQKRWNISSAVPLGRPIAPVTLKKGIFNYPKRLSRPAGDPSFVGIEFLIDSYVLFYSDNTLKIGGYSVTNDTTLFLESLGTIHIILLDNSTFDFVLTPLDLTKPIQITAAPAPVTISLNSPRDSAFYANTWILDSTVDLSTNIAEPYEQITALFSQYGTYLVKSPSETAPGSDEYSTNSWLWSNPDHDRLCYDSWSGANITDCSAAYGSVKIVSLAPPYTTLIMEEGELGDSYRYYLHKQ